MRHHNAWWQLVELPVSDCLEFPRSAHADYTGQVMPRWSMALQPPRPGIKFPTHLLSISTRATEPKVRGLKACRGVVELPVLCPFSLKLYYGLLSPPPQKLVTKLPTFEIEGSSISARPPIACRAYHFTRASSRVCVNLWSPTILLSRAHHEGRRSTRFRHAWGSTIRGR